MDTTATPVRKAVIPAAGMGTRFLPATRSVQKVMLPVLDIPSLHMVVAEAASAGIDRIAVIVSARDRAIEEYFEPNPGLEAALRASGKPEVADAMRSIAEMATVEVLVQDRPRGLGHAVSVAADWVGEEAFAVLLPDDLIWADGPTIGEMARLHSRLGASVLAVKRVPDAAVPGLGIVDAEPVPEQLHRVRGRLHRLPQHPERLHRVRGMVEKPALADAPSNLAIIGRYVLTPGVFRALENTAPGAIGEVQVTDAIAALIPTEGVFAYEFPGDHFDVGVPVGMLEAAIYAGLRRPDIAPRLRTYLAKLADADPEA